MKAISELFIAAVELLEAEGRYLRQQATRLGVAFTLFLVAGLLGAVGVLMLAGALFSWLQKTLSLEAALIIVGVLILAGAGALIWKAGKTIE